MVLIALTAMDFATFESTLHLGAMRELMAHRERCESERNHQIFQIIPRLCSSLAV